MLWSSICSSPTLGHNVPKLQIPFDVVKLLLKHKERPDLEMMKNNIYLTIHLNARAENTCIQDCLHQHKFELERLERSY